MSQKTDEKRILNQHVARSMILPYSLSRKLFMRFGER